jgi:hypothetical protein
VVVLIWLLNCADINPFFCTSITQKLYSGPPPKGKSSGLFLGYPRLPPPHGTEEQELKQNKRGSLEAGQGRREAEGLVDGRVHLSARGAEPGRQAHKIATNA